MVAAASSIEAVDMAGTIAAGSAARVDDSEEVDGGRPRKDCEARANVSADDSGSYPAFARGIAEEQVVYEDLASCRLAVAPQPATLVGEDQATDV